MKIQLLLLFLLYNFITNFISYLEKYSAIDTYETCFIFESKDFKEDEQMNFKIKSYKGIFNQNYITYYYIDNDLDINKYSSNKKTIYFESYSYESSYEDGIHYEYEIKYFTIKKKISEFEGTQGHYMYIDFYLNFFTLKNKNNWAQVTNTKNDEGEYHAWVIRVIVSIIAVVMIILIIYFICSKIKEKKALLNAEAAEAAEVNTANQIAVQQNAIKAQTEYTAQQNMQSDIIDKKNYQPQKAYQAQKAQEEN